MQGPSYLGLIRSISWLLMPWLLTTPGHQQPWYWLCRIGRFLFYFREDFKYLRRINVEKWHKCKHMFMFPLKNSARKGLRSSNNIWYHASWSTLLQVMACPLFGTEPLRETMLIFVNGSLWSNFSEISISMLKFSSNIIKFKESSANKVWWQCLVPTSTTRFASDAGYRMAKM